MKTHSHFRHLPALALASFLLCASAHAAGSIDWTAEAVEASGTSQIAFRGQLLEAANFGARLSYTTRVGGVDFRRAVTASELDDLRHLRLTRSAVGAIDGLAPVDNDAFAPILDGARFRGPYGSDPMGATITLTGLQAGADYLVQFFVADARRIAEIADRRIMVDGYSFDPGITNGLILTGTFTASGPSQPVEINLLNQRLGKKHGFHLNAYQLRGLDSAGGSQAQADTPNDHADILAGDAFDGAARIVDDPEARAERLEWFLHDRFGMMICIGLVSQWGGHYPAVDGEMLKGGDHMALRLRLSNQLYERIANVFNPVQFDAEDLILQAKGAGMKYIVFIAKHQDGFAMYDSPSSDYDIVERTPFGRDMVAEIAEACRKHGLKLGIYYCLGRDWHDPDVPTNIKRDGVRRSNFWDFPHEDQKDFSKYFERKVKPQIRELMTQYGQVDLVWFDTPEYTSAAQSAELVHLIRTHQPQAVINSRVGNRMGDYLVHELRIPDGKEPDPWESCITMNSSWFYGLHDENWKSTARLLEMFVDIVSKGGNFLLNIGPDGQGVNPEPARERLAQIGAWMEVHGESIYGAKASPFYRQESPDWGRITFNDSGANDRLYLHVTRWPDSGEITLRGLENKIRSAVYLANGAPADYDLADTVLTIDLPAEPVHPHLTTIRLELDGPVRVAE